jgi:hypothetical protein
MSRLLTPIALLFVATAAVAAPPRHTVVAIRGDDFLINGEPTLKARTWQGASLEGLLPNARLVQGIFDDDNPQTRARWVYPDSGKWDPERNTAEFTAAMAGWRQHGLLAFTLNLQGGSPMGYGNQGWKNTAFNSDGSLRPEYMARAGRIIDRADELGMVVILGLYYFGQDQNLADDAAIRRGIRNAVEWVFDRGYTNVLIEIDNECTEHYHHDILKAAGVAELVEYAKSLRREGRRLLCSVSHGGGKLPLPAVAGACDFILLHGNGVKEPARIAQMVRDTRAIAGAARKPVVFNEDDHYDFEKPDNNFAAATRSHASWGYFDYRMKDEPFSSGFQSVPVDWRIDSPRKQAFFDLLAKMTGAK